MTLTISNIEIKKQEIKLLLAIKLFEEELVSLGKAAEISGYTERSFSEILLKRGIPSIKYVNINPQEELKNA